MSADYMTAVERAARNTLGSHLGQAEALALLEDLRRLLTIEAVAHLLREPYQQGGPSAEFVTLRRLLERQP